MCRYSCQCTHCVGLSAIVPPQAISIETLQPKRSATGPYSTCSLLNSKKYTTYLDINDNDIVRMN